jgi:hypothetical protein
MNEPIKYREYIITQKPEFFWYEHEEYTGAEDKRCGHAHELSDAKSDIDNLTIEEQEHTIDVLKNKIDSKIEEAINLAVMYGGIDGAHHKDWLIDQMVRKLAGERYDQIVADACAGEDGPDTFSWDCGIAP